MNAQKKTKQTRLRHFESLRETRVKHVVHILRKQIDVEEVIWDAYRLFICCIKLFF